MRNHTLIRWTTRTAIVLLSGVCVAACAGDDSAPTASAPPVDSTQAASVKIAIAVEEEKGSAAKAPVEDGSSFGQRGFGATPSFANVTSIKLDVLDPVTQKYFNKGTNFLESSPGVWEVTLPFLPKIATLTFVAHAFDASKTEIFTGSITQSVQTDNLTVNLPLSPSNDGATVALPGIKKITIPAQFVSGQPNNIIFGVQGLAGDDIDYVIDATPVPGGGTFSPLTGGIKLYNIYGSFVAQYTPPAVQTATDVDHSITISNQGSNAVTTTFTTHVVSQGSTQGAKNTGFNVLFNPVINSLSSQRFLGTSNVLWKASASDDGPAAALSYLWTFTPGGNPLPKPDFLDDTANGALLLNYTPQVTGTLTVAVTDGNGGKTTMHTQISANEFPDNPIVVGNPTGLNSIRAGGSHTCVMLNNGAVRCWGLGASGQLGYGNSFTIGDNELPFTAGDVPLGGFGDLSSALTTGASHTCSLLTSGSIRCWGKNNLGQLGYGDNTGTMANVGDAEAIDTFGYVNVGSNAGKVVAGGNHTCAILDTQNVRCWGDGTYGELGYGNSNSIGDNEQPWEAGDVNVGGTVRDLALGLNHTCALLTTGKVRCWGRGVYGQLGYSSTSNLGDNEVPATAGDVNLGGNAVQITAGDNHTCALLDTGYVRCWGLGSNGQLGYGNTTSIGDNELPFVAGDVNTGVKVLQVAAGGNHTCALLATGDVKCWGLNTSGELGYGNTNPQSTISAPPAGVVDLGGASAMQITAGTSHTCALLDSGNAWCWGLGASGQLGYGNTTTIGDNEQPTAAGDINILGP